MSARWIGKKRQALALTFALVLLADSSQDGPKASGAEAVAATRIAVARGKVDVEGGLVGLSAESEGIVTSVPVREGDPVVQGQVLLTMSTDIVARDVAVAEAEWRLAKVRRQTQADRLPAAQALARHWAQATKKGAGDPIRAEEVNKAVAEITAALAVADAEAEVAMQRFAQTKARLNQTKLRAPQAGIVVAVAAQPGTYLSPQGAPALVLLPDRPLLVRAEVNEAFLPLVALGDHASVNVEGQAGDGQSLRATVTRLSPIFQPTRLSEDGQSRPDVKVVDCYLDFDRPPDLRVGQGVTVSFDPK